MNKTKLIIALSGKIGSGKTTLAGFLSQKFEQQNKRVKFLNFADPLKAICYILTGYYGLTQEEKNIYLPVWNMTVGELLQKLGTDVMRVNFDQDVWVKATQIAIENNPDYDVFLIGDCRFYNEVSFVELSKGVTIRIDGDPANVRKNSKRDLNHASETELDSFKGWSFYYENNKGLEDLENFSALVVNSLANKI